MSEYQYYEFAAIDRPLTAAEMAALRKVSTRARISARGFVNHYEWGDLSADPDDWMRRYFDAYVYTANWRTCNVSLRVPLATFRQSDLQPYIFDGALAITTTDAHWIIDWSLDDSENDDRFSVEEGSGWMERLLPIRDELMRGDMRALYLGWLASEAGLEDDTLEPEPPAGLSDLTPAQQALAEFIEIDPDMITAASMGGAANAMEPKAPRRLAQLRELAQQAAAIRLAREAEERAAEEAEHRRHREVALHQLMADVDRHWADIEAWVVRGTASSYTQAVRALTDLADGYALTSARENFENALRHLLVHHAKRGALLRRLVEAGLWSR